MMKYPLITANLATVEFENMANCQLKIYEISSTLKDLLIIRILWKQEDTSRNLDKMSSLKEQVCKLLQKDSSIAIDQMPIVLQSPFNMEILQAFCLIDLKILEDLQYKVPSTPLNMLSYTGIKCLSNESGSRLFAECLHILSRVQPSLGSISQIKKHN